MLSKYKSYLVSKAYILLTALALGSVVGIGYAVIKLDRDNHLATVRRDLEQDLYTATDQIQLRFFEAVLVAKHIENLLNASTEVNEAEISRFVADLQLRNPGVRAVALAPGLEVTHSFPITGNRKTIGLKYWQVPEQMASVAQAYRRQSPIVDGPVPLVQGGTGYILRYPVFMPNPSTNVEQFWGVISIVISADGLLSAQRHDFGDTEKYSFSLREIQASATSPIGVRDDAGPLNARPVTTEFKMLGSTWRATGRPTGGWPSYSPQSPYLLAFVLFLAVILVGVLLIIRRFASEKESARALLAESIGCLNEGFIAFDDHERMMLVNEKYLEYYPEIGPLIAPGMTMKELLAHSVKNQPGVTTIEDENTWIAERLERFRNPGVSFSEAAAGNRWLKVTEAKTPHGYTVGISTDVTAEQRALKAAEAADREKTEFLNNVSHELRTPLTVISGRASFLHNSERLPQSRSLAAALENAAPADGTVTTAVANFQRFVSEQSAGIENSAKHMLRLVEDLLDWTRVARGQLELDLERIEVTDLGRSVVDDLRSDAEAKGLTLTYSEDGPAQAMADTIRLKQILYNLISNAIKFTDTGNIHLSIEQMGDQIVFSVADTGCGIAQDNLERVFQRFQQVDGSMSRQKGGLGLGLAIAEQLAVLHGGALSLESELGKGSTFRLTLTRAEAAFQRTA
ncbi:ATP-binding protein [Pseudosulfitobacter sp. DSM 107133]|uniref:ATP-binding protein n=1 Tax=Pseudosulfitobacter sp. DSM 107133 TaxID=2883100 RepID=UPI000DF17C0B|nr:ATP-binding protein [Pseudosulfitobacter sp. DSM 107133]UOA27753.1 Non-motile and phage-resistance protein [Pseudosulfitobacter sp. DSM 107133]